MSETKYRLLATDYDGTIAFEGKIEQDAIDSLRRVLDAGRYLILVTGRELSDLFNTCDHVELFQLVVAENGAVIYEPPTTRIHVVSAAPPRSLTERLTQMNVPFSTGHSVVATVEPHEQHVIAAIHDLGLDWHVIFNKGSVMVLPSDTTKATGLSQALDMIGVPWTATIGAGDAENDLPFLRRCGFAAAVANALPSVQEIADLVTAAPRGTGVAELIDRWLAGTLEPLTTNPAREPQLAARE